MRRHALTLLAVCVLTACQPTSLAPSPTTQQRTATPPQVTPHGYTLPGAAEPVLATLVRAAGSDDLLKIELTADDARVAVLDGKKRARTWTMRDGRPTEVDGDTQYVGQATFRLSDFNLDDVGALFAAAARSAGSASSQQLQVVDYYHGDVYMTVTTTPESRTVFFRADCVQVPELDYRSVAGLSAGLRDAASGVRSATQVGWHGADVWVDGTRADGRVRAVRPERYPTRRVAITTPPPGPAFDPALVQAAAVQRVVHELSPTEPGKVRVEIDRRDQMSTPTMTFTLGNRVLVTDLAGNDITSQVHR